MLKELSISLSGIDLKQGSNGVGPNRWGYWRIFIPYQTLFCEAALNHDINYSMGGTEEDKKRADIQFFQECMDESGINPFAILMSCVYFLLVHYFGYKYFYYN